MGEFYTEQMVQQKPTLKTLMKKSAVITMVLVVVMLCWVSLMAIPLLLGAIALAVFLWRRLDLEFEYLYYQGDVDIDKIMGKQKRRRVVSANIKGIDIIAPTGAPELQKYENLKVYDCSSNTGNPTYEMVCIKKDKKGNVTDEKIRVIFEPKKEILDNLRMYDSRKVIL